MPRPRQSTEVLAVKGAFVKHPERKSARKLEPKRNGPLGSPPEHFSDELVALWYELESIMHHNVACLADRAAVEGLCLSFAEVRKIGRGERDYDPAVLVRFERGLAGFGMTPADRSRVQQMPQDEDESPLAKLLRKGKGVN